jgi:hypothetical protein
MKLSNYRTMRPFLVGQFLSVPVVERSLAGGVLWILDRLVIRFVSPWLGG